MTFKESDLLKTLVGVPGGTGFVVEGVSDQDDAAVLQLPQGFELCATTDFVRGTGFTLFQRGYLSFRDLGRYVVGANVSDLAAMGATPLCYLSVVRYESSRTLADIQELLAGISEACADLKCPLVGGDSGSYHADVLSGTALGYVPSGRRLSRKTMRAGDALFVSGEVGGAGAALAAALAGKEKELSQAFDQAVGRWKALAPRTALGQALVGLADRVSAMDVSDGITASLNQLQRITGLGFQIHASALPIADSTVQIAKALGHDPVHLACSASVDFELLVSCPPAAAESVLGAARQVGVSLARIGSVTADPKVKFVREDGSLYETTPGVPWDHQVADMARIFDPHG